MARRRAAWWVRAATIAASAAAIACGSSDDDANVAGEDASPNDAPATTDGSHPGAHDASIDHAAADANGADTSLPDATTFDASSADSSSSDASLADAAIADSSSSSSDASIADANDADAAHDAGSSTKDAGGADAALAGHPPYPVVAPDRPNGVVMKDFRLVTIVASNDTNGATWLDFDDHLVASQWWKTVSAPYGLGTIASHVKVVGPAMTTNPDTAALESYITGAIDHADAGDLSPDGKTLYMLYIPSGIWFVEGATDNTGCKAFGGFHSYGSNQDLIYGMVQQCPPNQIASDTSIEETTRAASHEIIEAATDPFPTPGFYGWTIDCGINGAPPTCSPWAYAPAVGEVGDLCAWTSIVEGPYLYTRVWSNAAKGDDDPCLPASTLPYDCAASDQVWYPITAGATIQVPIHGWSSTATSATWNVYGGVSTQTVNGFTATTPSWSKQKYEALSESTSFTMSVTAPAAAQSGDYAVVLVDSYTCIGPTGCAAADEIHPWTVGVYVP